ncbi:FAD-binding FR-type domain-containing protein [Balamuthia mandrillaris]
MEDIETALSSPPLPDLSESEESLPEVEEEHSEVRLTPLGKLDFVPLPERQKSRGEQLLAPLLWLCHKYGRGRDWVIARCFSHPYLNAPLFGPLTGNLFLPDINIMELLSFVALFTSEPPIMVVFPGAKWGTACTVTLALLVLPVAKNSILYFLFGLPFERGIKYHRWLSLFFMVPVTLHGVLARGMHVDVFEYSMNLTGFIAWLAYCFILITSFELLRRSCFELFFYCHFAFVVFCVFVALHDICTLVAMIPGLLMYAVDVLFRLARYFTSRSTRTLSITTFANDNNNNSTVRLEMKKKFNFNAGQWVLVNIPSISWHQWHPFSISSAPQQPTMTLHIKDSGGWTHRLVERLKQQQEEEDDEENKGNKQKQQLLRLKVDGPWGKTAISYSRYKTVAIFAAGAGVTPMISILKDIYARQFYLHQLRASSSSSTSSSSSSSSSSCSSSSSSSSSSSPRRSSSRASLKKCKVERVYFVWVVPSVETLEWFREELLHMWNHPLPNLQVKLRLFVTAPPAPSSLSDAAMSGEWKGLPYSLGRPNIGEECKGMCRESQGRTKRVGVMVCGPSFFDSEVRWNCVRHTVAFKMRFDFHHETFDF